MDFILPDGVRFIIGRIEEHGYRADVVGGAVRDMYLGRCVYDYDVTTNALPEKIKEIFSDVRTIDTGIKHGTVTVHLDGENYEVTTYRVDGEYSDSRHPMSVEFTQMLSLDVLRRDFTMNALCYNEGDGITDYVGGIADIDSRIIRTVGNPTERFSEDALRILRALRFSATLGFKIEENTAAAVRTLSHKLSDISRERVYAELTKLLAGDNAYAVISDFIDTLRVVIPGISGMACDMDRFISAPPIVRFISLFDTEAASVRTAVSGALESLKSERRIRELADSLLSAYLSGIPEDGRGMLIHLYRFGREAVELALELGALRGMCGEKEREALSWALFSGVPYSVRELRVNGRDLIAVGLLALDRGKHAHVKQSSL